MRHARLSLVALLSLAACEGTTTTDDDVTGTEIVPGVVCDESDLCVMSGTIVDDFTMTTDRTWLLSGGVFFGDGTAEVTVTIDPGVTVYGESATDGLLVVQRGARLIAEGTKQEPIVFTSSKEEGSRDRGDWGGVVINGRAPANTCDQADLANCSLPGEAGTGEYGGDDPGDDSGVLKYVRIEFGGTLVNDQNEVNGLALQGVGSGTELDYIQVHKNADDGIEFFGGTVDARHVLVTGVGDDLLDWTDGWTGRIQYAILQQVDSDGDNGIEGDNNEDAMDAAPRSMPSIQNITILGGGPDATSPTETSDIGILLRHGTAARISHAIVAGWGEACLDVDSAPTFAAGWDEGSMDLSGDLTVDHSLFHCAALAGVDDADMFPEVGDSSAEFTNADLVLTLGEGNAVADPELGDAWSDTAPDYVPSATGPAMTSVAGFGGWFEATDFLGGVGQTDWTEGWTTHVER